MESNTLNIQPPDWVGDVIVAVILIAFHQLLRTARSYVYKRMPSWIFPLLFWCVLSFCFLDFLTVRKVLKKVLPFVDHYIGESLGTTVVPLAAKCMVWMLATVVCAWQAWATKQNGPLDELKRLHAIKMIQGLHNTGYLMEEEFNSLQIILNDHSSPRKDVAQKLLSKLRIICIKGKSADQCPPCKAVVDVVLSTSTSTSTSSTSTQKNSDETQWPAPIQQGPLQELGDVNLTRMEEAVRVWLKATQRDGKAKFAPFNEVALEIVAHFDKYCNTKKKRGMTIKDVEFLKNALLIKKLKERIQPAGLKFNQYKLMWQWYCEVVATLNSDATIKKAWDNRWIIGFVGRGEAEQMLQKGGDGSVLFRFSSDENNKRQFNLCASVLSNERIVHSLITPRPLVEERFLIPTRNKDQDGNLILSVERFKTFKDLFQTYTKWKRFQPSGVLIQKAFPKPLHSQTTAW
jgi:hypothetical protein